MPSAAIVIGYMAMQSRHWNVLAGDVARRRSSPSSIGGVVALPALKLSVEYLILLTLAVSSVIIGFFIDDHRARWAVNGLISLPTADLFGWTLQTPEATG